MRQFINGLNRPLSLSTNTVVVDNLKIKMGSGDDAVHATFSGSLTAARTISVPDANVDLGKIATNESGLSTAATKIGNLETLSGVASGSTGLGSFTGSTIADNSTVKTALQSLETLSEASAGTLSSHVANTSNPHSVTKSQVGLSDVTNDAQIKKIASAVNENIVIFDGTTGDTVKDSGKKLADYSLATHDHSGVYEPANSNIQSHISSTSNPHSVTKAQVGLSNVDDVQQLPMSYLDTDNTLASNSDSKVSSQKAIKAYIASQVGNAVVGAVIYKSTFDASAGNFEAIVNPKQGWLYKVSVAGTISGELFSVGDNLYVNKDVTGTPVLADIDHIDNTEAIDILRNSMLSNAKIFVGSESDVAAAVSMSGEASIVASGAVTLSNSAVIGKVLTGYTQGAGTISATDSILSGIQKADGNAAAAKSVADAALPSASFTDSAVTSKVLTGYSAAAGTVAATDSILQALQKLDGNIQTVGGVNPFVRSEVAGESFAANSSFVTRLALSSETAGRVYKSDKSSGNVGSETNTIYGYGVAVNSTSSAISAGSNINVYLPGAIVTLQSSDSAFNSSDVGKPVYMASSGAFSTTIPSSTNDAVVLVGIVKTTSSFVVGNMQILGII